MYHIHHLVTCDEGECDFKWCYSRWRLLEPSELLHAGSGMILMFLSHFFLQFFPCNTNHHPPPPVIPIGVFNLRRLFKMAGIYRLILSFSSHNSQVHTQEQQRWRTEFIRICQPAVTADGTEKEAKTTQKKPSAEDFSCFFFFSCLKMEEVYSLNSLLID